MRASRDFRGRRLRSRLLASGALGGLCVLLFAVPASATMSSDDCQASGTFQSTGETHDATEAEVEIPSEDDVAWTGSVAGDGETERNINGFVKVDFPPPLPDPTIGEWDGPSTRYANDDVYHYELPSVLEGFDIKVFGEHHEPGVDCSGSVTVRLDGGGIGNPATLAALAFTVISLVNVALAIGVL
jgi:hypothetical protein